MFYVIKTMFYFFYKRLRKVLLLLSLFIFFIMLMLGIFMFFAFNKNIFFITSFFDKNLLSNFFIFQNQKNFDFLQFSKFYDGDYSYQSDKIIKMYFFYNYIARNYFLIIRNSMINSFFLNKNQIDRNYGCSALRNIIEISNQLHYTVLLKGNIKGTFIDSVRFFNLNEHDIQEIISLLKCQVNFKKLKQEDKFSILVSLKSSINSIMKNNVLGIRLHVSGKDYYIFCADNGKFYDRNGMRLIRNYIPFPVLKPFRISSNFDLKRLNPITRQISPHPGIDFAVPIGTPVISIGDGEVIISKKGKTAGNYIVIQHNHHCVSRYMHLNKILVKSGQKVKKGDNIAFSGNTGRSTGPHLHFEIWINKRPVNPLITQISSIESLPENERVKYLSRVNKIMPKLNLN